MLQDALLLMSNAASLTGIAGAGTGYSDVIDLSTSRDIAVAEVPISVMFNTPPTSGTGGATLNVAVQTSADNSTWVTLEETSPVPIANYAPGQAGYSFIFRGWLNAGVLRYLRMAYTPSAVLTAGVVTAQIGGDWPRTKSYPRNYVA